MLAVSVYKSLTILKAWRNLIPSLAVKYFTLMAESEEELKSLLMKVETEKLA